MTNREIIDDIILISHKKNLLKNNHKSKHDKTQPLGNKTSPPY